MAMEKFKMSYTVSMSDSLDNGMTQNLGSKMYQRVTIFGKLDKGATIPFKSLSFADGVSSITREDNNVIYTITLQNKDLIIEAELLEDAGGFTTDMTLAQVLTNLPSIFDENGDVISGQMTFVTANNGTMPYITIPNMASEGGAPK